MRPRLLDLFCGAGGAAMGYHRAGFDVVGVDNRPQPNYPFEFVQDDALALMSTYPWWDVPPFHAIHASPPCQAYSTLRKCHPDRVYPDLVARTRELLQASGLPYVIENVPGAPLIDPVMICGSSLGLKVRRHRLFESNVPLMAPSCAHGGQGQPVGVYGGGPCASARHNQGTIAQKREAMETDWMTYYEINQAIPPAYTELIGAQLLAHVRVAA